MTNKSSMWNRAAHSTVAGRLSGWSQVRVVVISGLAALVAFPALADSGSGTQADGQLPRNYNAANITVETDPKSDPQGDQDPGRVDESFQPKGIELGQFLYFPSIETREAFNSNVYAQKDNPKSDFITTVIPKVELRSRFSEHALNMTARAEKLWMRKNHSDDQVNGDIGVDGRYDFNRDWTANGNVKLSRTHEDRGSPDDAGGVEPTPVDSFSVGLGNKVRVEKYTFSGGLDIVRQTFGNVATDAGTTINNGDRDRTEFVGTGRATYELFPGYAAIVELQGNRREYDQTFDDNGYERSSQGWQATTGVGVDVTQLIRGDFTAGYLQQDYEDDRFSDLRGFALKADFTWTPSRLTVVVPSIARSVAETTTVDASGIVQNTASLLVRHEYARNILLTGNVSFTQDEFQGLDRTDETYEGTTRVIWTPAPEYYLGGEVAYRRRNSNLESAEYDQYVLSVRLGLRM